MADCLNVRRCDPLYARTNTKTKKYGSGATGDGNNWRNGNDRIVSPWKFSLHPQSQMGLSEEPMTTTNLRINISTVPWGNRLQRRHGPAAHNNTCGNIKHAFLTPRSFATCSTISRVTTIMSETSASRPFFPRILRRPHSFIANAASSTLRLVARARSANVHLTTT